MVFLDISPEAASGGMVGAVTGLIWLIVGIGKHMLDKQRARDLAAVGPVAPQPLPTPTVLPPDVLNRMAKLESSLGAWQLDDCRAEVRALQAEARKLSAEHAIAAQRIIELTYKLEVAEKANGALQRELSEERHERELLETKLAVVERSDTDRPPR